MEAFAELLKHDPPSAASIRGSGTGSEGTRRTDGGAGRGTPRSAAKAGSARRAEARQRSPFALRQSAHSQSPRAKESRVQPSSDAASRSHAPMPAPNRRCSFSMTHQNCRLIGKQMADAEHGGNYGCVMGPERQPSAGFRVSLPDPSLRRESTCCGCGLKAIGQS